MEIKTEAINTRVSKEQKELIEKIATREGLSIASFIRSIVLREARKILQQNSEESI